MLSVLLLILVVACLFVLYLMIDQRNDPLFNQNSTRTVACWLLAGLFCAIFWLYLAKAKKHRSFKQKIEKYLCDLFPHSNNENYARENLPVANNIRT